MSDFKKFVEDFPTRCEDLLTIFGDDAKIIDREVTLLLSLMMSSFILTYERTHKKHPSSENMSYPVDLKNKAKNKKLFSSGFKYSEVDNVKNDIEAWNHTKEKDVCLTEKENGTIVKIIRNALAHGSIWTKADNDNQIETIVFITYNKNKKFDCIQCSPQDLKIFFKNWIQLIKESAKSENE